MEVASLPFSSGGVVPDVIVGSPDLVLVDGGRHVVLKRNEKRTLRSIVTGLKRLFHRLPLMGCVCSAAVELLP